jgi:hypothetical protein
MELNNCPNCETKLHPPLKSSGRQICTSCGWSNTKRSTELISDFEPVKPFQLEEASLKPKRVREYQNTILIAILIGLVVSQCSKPRYEYATVSPSDLSFEESMDKYGSEGWKAVSCRRAKDSTTDEMNYECIMIQETRLPR